MYSNLKFEKLDSIENTEKRSPVAKVLEAFMSAITLSVFVFLFLSIFFVTYVSKVENQIFRDEVNQVLNEFQRVTDKVESNIPYHTASPVSVSEIQVSDDEMNAWSDRNQKIIIESFKLVGIVFGSMIVLNVLIKLAFPQYISWMTVLRIVARAFLYLCFIGAAEFLFLRVVSSQYRTISTVEVKQKVFKKCADVLSRVE